MKTLDFHMKLSLFGGQQMPVFTADPVYCPCPGDYHLLFLFDHQGKWRQFLKVNTKYNAIATELLFHKVLYLEVREGSDQRREG